MWDNIATEQRKYVICMYIRLSSEDDDIRYNEMKDESNSITAQRRMLYDYINSRLNLGIALYWSVVTMVSPVHILIIVRSLWI